LFLLGYAFSIYAWVRKYLGKQQGLLAAMFFITCGRILFWDSFLGLIDILYSWIIFTNFMIIWHYSRSNSWNKLFIISYTLAAAGFLLKGIPTLVFQGITLLTLFFMEKRWRLIFSGAHFAGIAIFVFITGAYYFMYEQRNPEFLKTAFLRLLTESTQKSALGVSLAKTALHFLTFPLEVLYHFVPWTLMAVFLLNRKIVRRVYQHQFIRYCFWIFLLNILIYWFSPITYPRYLLMLIPLLFIFFLFLSKYHAVLHTQHYRIIRTAIPVLAFLLILAHILLPIIYRRVIPVDHLVPKVLLVLMMDLTVTILFLFSQKQFNVFYFLILILLISRISFNLFLVPYRLSESWMTLCRKDAIEIGKATKNKPMYYMTDTITMHNVYYLTREREQILQYKSTPETGAYFIVNDSASANPSFVRKYAMRLPYYEKTWYAGIFISDKP
jgi:4-amino-4-deoxy-L-arabinose transferase-like glycosyltransferase